MTTRDALGRLRSPRLHAVLSLGLVACLATGSTWASWSDKVVLTGTTLTAGRLDLKVNGSDAVTGYTSLSLTNMYPGASVAAVLVVKNEGTLPFTYTVASAATNDDTKNLAGAVVAKVTTASSITGVSPTATCGGTVVTGSGTSFASSLVGTGIKRTLAAGASEPLCLQAALPTDAVPGVQGATTSITLTLTAEQLP